jgi:GntR family transcriptional regulator/MocR family aminotransferase
VVLEDDYDSEYRYSGPPLPAMHGLADGGGIIYIRTFSNVMFRGLRIGYLVVPKDLIEPFRVAKWMADRHTPLVEQVALADFSRGASRTSHPPDAAPLQAPPRRLARRVPSELRRSCPRPRRRGGLHMTVRFSGVGNLQARAERNGVALSSSYIYYLSKPVPNEFLLGFSAASEPLLREAIKRLRGPTRWP